MLGKSKSQNGTRTGLTLLVCVVVLSLLLSGCAQKPKVYRVGILSGQSSFAAIGDGFKAKMTELGYVENQNITYIVQAPSADMADKQRLAKQLVDDKVDLIFAFPALETTAARAATQGTNTPVVFGYAQVEGTNLVKSVREPGGNMTGVRYPGPELISRRIEILHEIAPQVKRVWIGYDKNSANIPPAIEALRPTASSLGMTLVEVPVTTLEELQADLAARAKSADLGLDAILAMPDSLNTSSAGTAMLSKFAAEHQVPMAGGLASQVQGALFVNGTNFTNVGELAASLADKILKGTPAGTIPVLSPEQELTINYKVAQGLGLTVPEGLLKQAVTIIR
jgi:putative ABC transport system substrate-binding protein